MPRLIKDGVICEDQWLPADIENPGSDHFPSLQQWQNNSGPTVQLEPGDGAAALIDQLDTLEVVAINFTAFMDGRGFSYARELRERGFSGEIRALGSFIRDQLTYLNRCGFNSFQPTDDSALEGCLDSLSDFSEAYQASADKDQPLFRRRA
jgi:uncharacterized protein (DUF934 family)